MALMTALASGLAYRLARRYWPEYPGEVLWAWALLSLTPPLLLYSHQIWVEVPAMILVLVALGQLLSLQENTSSPQAALADSGDGGGASPRSEAAIRPADGAPVGLGLVARGS